MRVEPALIGSYVNAVLKPYGRRIGPDPASLDVCMIGGMLANNSSGMCCGVSENAYRTVRSMTVVLPNGSVLDTGAAGAQEKFAAEAPEVARGLLELRRRLLSDAGLSERVRTRYQMKNNNGYSLNAFVDFDSALDILVHLMIGSEGTLGFIAEAVLDTLPEYPRKYTGQLYFGSVQDAARAIAPLRESGARAAEIMDRASLRSVEKLPGAPALLAQLPPGASAILAEYQGADRDVAAFRSAAERTCRELTLIHDPEFTEDPAAQADLWKLRKGMIPSLGAMRRPGTTILIEDIVFPVPRLADGVTDLQGLFQTHGYEDAIIFGHAKDGNLHFVMSQSFNTSGEVRQFEAFMGDLVRVVSGKYDGALKAEHGTGRNMAPFLETEWGANACAIMADLKQLLDPGGILSPGVIINANPRCHVTDLKTLPAVESEVDKCIECGFCEPRCPSRRLTLTPRQRIVVRREMARLRTDPACSTELASLTEDYDYYGVETCAADGLCATSCPVGINTGDLTKRLRAEKVGPKGQRAGVWVAEHFGVAEATLRAALRAGHAAEAVLGSGTVRAVTRAAERVVGRTLPKWNEAVQHVPRRLPRTEPAGASFVYFPSCISRTMGVPARGAPSLAETLVEVARRAGVRVWIPGDAKGHCCGMPFGSTGYTEAFKATLHRTLAFMGTWTRQGELPVVIDMTSCAYTLRTCRDVLTEQDQALWEKLTLLDSLEFVHDVLLPKLEIRALDEDVVLHPNCAARKMNLQDKMVAVARRCARSVHVPLDLDCCAFAGDRGLLFPELTQSATMLEAAEVKRRSYDGYYSSNIPCETGMSSATGRNYRSVLYLVEKATRR